MFISLTIVKLLQELFVVNATQTMPLPMMENVLLFQEFPTVILKLIMLVKLAPVGISLWQMLVFILLRTVK